MEKSMLDIALEILQEKKSPMAFNTLWNQIVKKLGLSEEEAKNKVANFYSQITLDGRVFIENGKLSLRENVSSKKIASNEVNAVYEEMDQESKDSDDDDEEEENKPEEETEHPEDVAI